MRRIIIISAVLTFITSLLIISCQKGLSDKNGQTRLQIYLTDDPGDYEAVYIDVQDILINVTGDSVNGWRSLGGVNTGVYDLLTLVNDDDTLLADAEIPSGRLHQIRLVLGTENYVKLEGDPNMIKLETPSAQQSGLKLNVQMDVVDGILYKITLDFDVAKSIVKTGNGKYILKPVIRTVLEAVGGTIKGVVLPDTIQTAILAIMGPDTIASTYSGSNGGYIIKGLPAGSYSLSFIPGDTTFFDTTRLGIIVNTGQVTIVDTTWLHQ